MATRIFFIIIAVIYGGFGLWCLVSPRSTSQAIGYELKTPTGLIEYLAVYGGLELGMALFFALAAAGRAETSTALLLAVSIHALIALVRLGGAIWQGQWGTMLFVLLTLEGGIAIVGALLLRIRGA